MKYRVSTDTHLVLTEYMSLWHVLTGSHVTALDVSAVAAVSIDTAVKCEFTLYGHIKTAEQRTITAIR